MREAMSEENHKRDWVDRRGEEQSDEQKVTFVG